ncbi:MAG TPA: glycosyltransferase family 39 protein [Thermoanaerobaculia bacterium]|nr:glycosyltransferase family 39 protein [Thermoanaerobaculia bacterium]
MTRSTPRRRLLTSLAIAAGVLALLGARLARPVLHTDEVTYVSKVLDSLVQGRALPVDGAGAVFANKPPLSLWLMRGAFVVLGPGPFAARLPSIVAAAATAVAIYLFAAFFLEEAAGVVAALLFVLAAGPLGEHSLRRATPDALEILLMTVAIGCLEAWRRRRLPQALAGLLVAVAALAWVKSPFALAVLLFYLLVTELPARRAGVGTPRLALTAGLLVGVWSAAYLLWLAVLAANFSWDAVGRRLLLQQYARRLQGHIGNLEGPGYYATTIAADFGPLLVLPVVAAFVAWRRPLADPQRERHDALCLFAWAIAAPLLATLSASKLPWYPYLSYPGLALLLGVAAWRIAAAVSPRPWVRTALLALVVATAVWRLPVRDIWPREPQYRTLAGRLWEVSRSLPEARFVTPGKLRRGRGGDNSRESRFYVGAILWQQSRRPRQQGPCVVDLLDVPPASAPPASVVVILREARAGPPLFAVDRCDGRVRDRLKTR